MAEHDPLYAIGLEVLGALLATGIVALLSWFALTGVLPWFQRVVLQTVDVGGEWIGRRRDNREGGMHVYHFNLQLRQRGARLRGQFTALDELPNGTTTRKFSLRGKIHGNLVILLYEPSSTAVWGGGSFVLMVFDGGAALRGAISYARTKTNTIEARDDIQLERKPQA
jgi:hypothetical protein